MSGYSLQTAPVALTSFLEELVAELRATTGRRLVAVILHGSLAMGSFYPPKSDIDLLIVVEDLDGDGRQAVYDLLARRQAVRPYVGGLEVSVVRAWDMAHPVHPLPYLVHFGDNTTGPPPFETGRPPTDRDLVAHLMVSKTRGVSLFGPAPAQVIGEVDWADYLAAVAYDIDELLDGETVVRAPRYAVLNLCRWMMMQATPESIVPAKEEAAVWALEQAPIEHRALIEQALSAYRSEAPVRAEDLLRAGGPWDRDALLAFRDWAARNGA